MNQEFHAHIYFELPQKKMAEELYFDIQKQFSPRIRLGKIYMGPVGPHSLPMFTTMFGIEDKDEFLNFLNSHRNGLSVLIHEETGDDYRDHTAGAQWLGSPIALRFEHFERIKNDPSALVFPKK